MNWYLIIPLDVRECEKCGAYNLVGDDKCSECGAKMEAKNVRQKETYRTN